MPGLSDDERRTFDALTADLSDIAHESDSARTRPPRRRSRLLKRLRIAAYRLRTGDCPARTRRRRRSRGAVSPMAALVMVIAVILLVAVIRDALVAGFVFWAPGP